VFSTPEFDCFQHDFRISRSSSKVHRTRRLRLEIRSASSVVCSAIQSITSSGWSTTRLTTPTRVRMEHPSSPSSRSLWCSLCSLLWCSLCTLRQFFYIGSGSETEMTLDKLGMHTCICHAYLSLPCIHVSFMHTCLFLVYFYISCILMSVVHTGLWSCLLVSARRTCICLAYFYQSYILVSVMH